MRAGCWLERKCIERTCCQTDRRKRGRSSTEYISPSQVSHFRQRGHAALDGKVPLAVVLPTTAVRRSVQKQARPGQTREQWPIDVGKTVMGGPMSVAIDSRDLLGVAPEVALVEEELESVVGDALALAAEGA